MKKKIITVVMLLGVVLLGIKGKALLKSRQEAIANEALPKAEAVSVEVKRAKEGMMKQRESMLARVVSDKSIKLSTKLAGYIEKVYVEESQKVKKGTPLVRIDETELRSSIAGLQATLATQKADVNVAQSIYARNVKLYRAGGLSKEKLDLSRVAKEAKSSVIENTKQKIAQLEHQRSYLMIRAPFDGEIDALMLHEGDLAATGKPILSMSNGGQKLLFSYAPASSKIAKGQSVLIEGEEIGKIRAIYNTSTDGLTTAEVALNKALSQPVGSSVNIEVVTAQKEGCIVPSTTILHKKEGNFLMVYKEGKFTPLKVEVSMENPQQALVAPCTKAPIAQASEVKLAALPAYSKVELIGEKDE